MERDKTRNRANGEPPVSSNNLKQPNGKYQQPISTSTTSTSPSTTTTTTSSISPSLLLIWGSTLAYIFLGCCSNVYTLESLISPLPHSGYLITLTQFALTALVSSWSQIQLSSRFPYIFKTPSVPLIEWIPNIVLFLTVNVLNNVAFGYRISVPVHIILRSGGSVTTMAVGALMGRRYQRGQIAGVMVLTVGVGMAAMADAQTKGKMSSGSTTDLQSFLTGLLILFVAQVLSALMGIRTQAIYAKHGPHWQENLFYSHLLSLPFFLLFPHKVLDPLSQLLKSRPTKFSYGNLLDVQVPHLLVMLFANGVTQMFCILGVNRLGAVTSALGVTVVLNIRKLVSLFLSTWIFGNELPVFVWVGAALVFAGGGVYAGGDRWLKAREEKKKIEAKKEL